MRSDFLFYPLFREEIERYAEKPESKGAGYLLRLEKEATFDRSLLDGIAACGVPEKFFFSAKDSPFVLGGLGSVRVVTADHPDEVLEQLRGVWEVDPSIPVFGGFSFAGEEESAPEWAPFGRFRFTLPFIELRMTESGTRVAVNHLRKNGQATGEALAEITAALRTLDAARRPVSPAKNSPCCLTKQLIPEKPAWNGMIHKALAAIRAGDLQKVVLARKMVITRSAPWDPAEIIAALAGIEEDSFTFYYQLTEGIAFLGRSPERLFHMQDGRIMAEAIAGTRSRGSTPAADRRLEQELLTSQKEREEHRFVAGFVENGMKRICDDVRIIAAAEILKLKNVQHIVTRFTGRSTGELSPLTIARIFHPTPAVGGYPTAGIQEYLRRNEPFRRGWYGAPIGWMNRMNADFAVAIRSALVREKALHIFAGAGIVAQSNAHAEWKETEKKMDNFAAVLGESPCPACP